MHHASAPVSTAIDYAKFRSRSHDAVIRVYDEAGNVFETHEHKGTSTRASSRSGRSKYTLQTSLPSALRDNEAFFAVRTRLNGNWRCCLN
jgi:hypothetical protein